MKSFAKLSVALLILGCILFAIGNTMGGTVYSAWYDGRLHPWHEVRNIGFSDFSDIHIGFSPAHINEQVQDILQDAQNEVFNAVHDISPLPDLNIDNIENNASTFWSNNVKNLEFDLGCGTYSIQRGAEFSIAGTGIKQIKHWTDADTWHVSYSSPYRHNAAAAQRAVTITIPENMTFDDVNLNAGMASVNLCALTADKIDFNIGAGSLSAAPLTANSLSAKVGAGIAKIQLADRWENYCYEAVSGLGTVTVNGETLSGGLAGEAFGGTGAHALALMVGMGDIQITTKQD